MPSYRFMRVRKMKLRTNVYMALLAGLLSLSAACTKPVAMTGKRSLSGEKTETISDRERITVERIRRVGEMVVAYILDSPLFGPPRVQGMGELVKLFAKFDLLESKIYMYDGWGSFMKYEYSGSADIGWSFTISSYGSDGLLGPVVVPDSEGRLTVYHSEEDIIYNNGHLYQYPADPRRESR
jgi:hypothetical protein